jgi:hypothetical protein
VDPAAAAPEDVDAVPLFVEEVVVSLDDPLVVAAASVADAPPARVLGGRAVLAWEDWFKTLVSLPFRGGEKNVSMWGCMDGRRKY